jgi:DNA-binding XRE family transcriptional regulator
MPENVPSTPVRYRVDHDELKRRRLAAGLKAEAVALAIDRTKETVVSYEMGRVVPPLAVLFDLCALYDCELVDVLIAVDDTARDDMVASRTAQGLPGTLPDDQVETAAALLRRA